MYLHATRSSWLLVLLTSRNTGEDDIELQGRADMADLEKAMRQAAIALTQAPPEDPAAAFQAHGT